MRKKVIIAALSAFVTASFAGEAMGNAIFTGVGSGQNNGQSGATIELSGFFQIPKTSDMLFVKGSSGHHENVSAEYTKKTSFGLSDELPLFIGGGLGYQTWQKDKGGNKDTSDTYFRGSLLSVKHISSDMMLIPKVFVDVGLKSDVGGKRDHGYGADLLFKKDLFAKDTGTFGVFLDLEAKRLNTNSGNRDTAKVATGLSYVF